MGQLDIKNCTLYFYDGTSPTPNSLEIRIGDGNMSYKERRTIVFTRNRGKLDLTRLGPDVPMEVDLNIVWEFLKSFSGDAVAGDPPLYPHEFLAQEGAASAFVSTDADACAPYAINIVIDDVAPATCGTIETITLPYFRFDKIDGDFR